MAEAISETLDRLIAAEQKVRARRIADRPAALAVGDIDERARMQARDHAIEHHLFAERRARKSEPQQMALGGTPRMASARRAVCCTRSHTRGSLPRQTEPMNFADHGITAHPDSGADFAAGHARGEAALELRDAFRRPGARCRNARRRRWNRDGGQGDWRYRCRDSGGDGWRWNGKWRCWSNGRKRWSINQWGMHAWPRAVAAAYWAADRAFVRAQRANRETAKP
jgi:hypothetical protein